MRVKLPVGVQSWQDLAAMTPEEIRQKGLWPEGFLPLPHPNHPEGGMVFPKQQIDEVKKQEGSRPDAFRSGLRPARRSFFPSIRPPSS